MALDCKLGYLLFLAAVTSSQALDVSELDLDTSLNPRLVGAIYHLYKPSTSTKTTPITIDCNHPGVICRFGTSTLVTADKECDCRGTSGNVPIISGLTTTENKDTDKEISDVKDKDGTVSASTEDNESKVPIYTGVIDTNAVLNEAERPYNIWNFQKNSMDKGWRPSQDPQKTRVGELPNKFASYYPFSQPKLPSSSEDYPDFFPDFSDDSRYVFWRKPGPLNFPKPPMHNIAPNNMRRPTTKPLVKVTTDKSSTPSQASAVTPKRNV